MNVFFASYGCLEDIALSKKTASYGTSFKGFYYFAYSFWCEE